MISDVLPALSVQPTYGPLLTQMSAQEQLAYLATPQREGSSSLPAFARVRVSEADHLFGALGTKLVQQLGCGCGKRPLISL